MCLETIKNRIVSLKHNLTYSLITIRLATCFDPIGSSSGLHYKPFNVKRLRTSLGSQQCLQKMNAKGSCPMSFIFCKHYWDPKDVRCLLTLTGS
jgi:hypothetical protein